MGSSVGANVAAGFICRIGSPNYIAIESREFARAKKLEMKTRAAFRNLRVILPTNPKSRNGYAYLDITNEIYVQFFVSRLISSLFSEKHFCKQASSLHI